MSRLSGRDIAEIAKLLDESQFSSLELNIGDLKLKIRRDGGSFAPAEQDFEDRAETRAPAKAGAKQEAALDSRVRGKSQQGPGENEVDVPAPLLGNYYAAPRPGDDPFVQVGDKVTEDTTIAIIEVMKLMNPIRAGVSGTVTAILAENGKAVEEGQALIRVKVD